DNAPEALERRAKRRAGIAGRRDEIHAQFDCIHGHFVADKYLGLGWDTAIAAFFREPAQQAISNYRYLLEHPEIDHPAVKTFHEQKMTLETYLEWENAGNVQSDLLGSVPVEDL